MPRSEARLSAAEIVDAYARAFYAYLSPDLARTLAERAEARRAAIPERAIEALYEVEFEEVKASIYNWIAARPRAAQQLVSHLASLPGLTIEPERESTFAHHAAQRFDELHAALIYPTFGITGMLLNVVEFTYQLLAVFNASHSLTLREQSVLPASLATVLTYGREQLGSLAERMPQLAEGITPEQVYAAGVRQRGQAIYYPRSLWESI